MSVKFADVVTLRPTPEDIIDAVRYAIKSGVPYTYNRMSKDAWRRVARIARGKVNENLIRRYAERLGIESASEDKSYRAYDAFDFTFEGSAGRIEADVKTFHILTQFVRAPRQPFSVEALLSGVDHTAPDQWHRFFPMLVPQDYRKHKNIYVFGVSVEAKAAPNDKSALPFPWGAFPDSTDERSLVDADAIAARERDGKLLTCTVAWPAGIAGAGALVYERQRKAWQKCVSLPASDQEVKGLSSFLAIQLDDTAFQALRQQRGAVKLAVQQDAEGTYEVAFDAARFQEVFPRQDYALHLVGWIDRTEFEKCCRPLPNGAPCYFYPPRGDRQTHQPGTKTSNNYVLPGDLQPITSLNEI